jgi:hypothetical protein
MRTNVQTSSESPCRISGKCPDARQVLGPTFGAPSRRASGARPNFRRTLPTRVRCSAQLPAHPPDARQVLGPTSGAPSRRASGARPNFRRTLQTRVRCFAQLLARFRRLAALRRSRARYVGCDAPSRTCANVGNGCGSSTGDMREPRARLPSRHSVCVHGARRRAWAATWTTPPRAAAGPRLPRMPRPGAHAARPWRAGDARRGASVMARGRDGANARRQCACGAARAARAARL